ncbi:type I methionyl aminopeptidase [bacterium]|nr:type I methionyl aminopeptidase [bacterium]
MSKISKKITAMREGGAKLREVKQKLEAFSQVGKSFMEIENEAQRLIKACGAEPNFDKVEDYHWATCINKNEGIVHGIPRDDIFVEDGDLISIDLGLLWKGWNLDTSISFIAGKSTPEKDYFLQVGKKALEKAIHAAQVGKTVYDISHQIEKTVVRGGFDPTWQLTGHYIGRQLHEEPYIPCIAVKSDRKHHLELNDTLAVEVMYAMGDCELQEAADGWTYETVDKSLTALFENTILITKDGPEVLT